ncbi:MAG: BRCT domain-containing protein [Planctomycetes bacterium]|nr:BRCT domain-containing protein [Planctomycetota bacterium]
MRHRCPRRGKPSMSATLDPDGQPIVRSFNAKRLEDSAIDELIGVCRGVLADGAVSDGEALFLLDWLNKNRAAANLWPANVLYERLRRMLLDKQLDPDEQGELLVLLRQVIGGSPSEAADLLARVDTDASGDPPRSVSTALPLDDPQPTIEFVGRQFCLTGKFVYGSRTDCEAEVIARGGAAKSGPSRSTSYLVIGHVGSAQWIHSSHGRKIEKAVELRELGAPVAIVSELHWTNALIAMPR